MRLVFHLKVIQTFFAVRDGQHGWVIQYRFGEVIQCGFQGVSDGYIPLVLSVIVSLASLPSVRVPIPHRVVFV